MGVMATFEPDPGAVLDVGGARIEVLEHPNAPKCPFAAEGMFAVVYQVRDDGGRLLAWKVMKEKHRDPALGNVCTRLQQFAGKPGLRACNRTFVSSRSHPTLVGKRPALQCSIVMPWVSGRTWFDVQTANAVLPRRDALKLAAAASGVFAFLEKAGLAHTDLSPGNLVFDPTTFEVQLVDLEGMYRADFPAPAVKVTGTPGYQHLQSHAGLWSPDGDRFAAAILLSEILAMTDPGLVQEMAGDPLFAPKELQQASSARFARARSVLAKLDPGIADLLSHAWHSQTLSGCPTLAQWHDAVQTACDREVPRTAVSPSAPIWAVPLLPPEPPRFVAPLKSVPIPLPARTPGRAPPETSTSPGPTSRQDAGFWVRPGSAVPITPLR